MAHEREPFEIRSAPSRDSRWILPFPPPGAGSGIGRDIQADMGTWRTGHSFRSTKPEQTRCWAFPSHAQLVSAGASPATARAQSLVAVAPRNGDRSESQ